MTCATMVALCLSMFASDGSLLIPTDKSSITHAVEGVNPTQAVIESETSPI